jgi:membrane protein YqaA with SNARE-associated domain
MFERLEGYANIIIEFVKAHEGWAPLVVFLLAFGESLAFISLLLPAWAALIGIGTIVMAGGINFWPIWIAAALGAAMGDWLSYWIGRKLEYTVQHIWPLSKHPDLIPKGEAFMKKWGVAGIFIGRFNGLTVTMCTLSSRAMCRRWCSINLMPTVTIMWARCPRIVPRIVIRTRRTSAVVPEIQPPTGGNGLAGWMVLFQ